MKIKHDEIEIPENDPFKNCKLDRKKHADVLTTIVTSYSDGFVLAINNEWGTGKTTFVKMWQQQMKNSGIKTLYFNAWENDFHSDPLIALMAELKTITSNKDDKRFKTLLSKGAVITQYVLPAIIKAIIDKHIDSKSFVDIIDNATKSAGEILKGEVDEYAKKKKGLLEFRIGLGDFIDEHKNNGPVVFIIDELDRCRPNYAVEVLEKVKHFFGVTGIVFILSIDKLQLSNAIRGFYGSEQINASEYLRRFIDLEYTLSAPKTGVFCRYLYDYFDFAVFFESKARRLYHQLSTDKDLFLNFSEKLFNKDGASLRQQEKIFAHARLSLNSFGADHYVFPELFILLHYVKDFNKELYERIKGTNIELQELIDEVRQFFPKTIDQFDIRHFTYIEAELIFRYSNYYGEVTKDYKTQSITRDKTSNEIQTIIKSRIDLTNSMFLANLESFYNDRNSHISLSYLIEKIELMQNILI